MCNIYIFYTYCTDMHEAEYLRQFVNIDKIPQGKVTDSLTYILMCSIL